MSGICEGRVVIVTTGTLGHLPWSSLPSLIGVPVVVAPSATSWLTAKSGAQEPAYLANALGRAAETFARDPAEAVGAEVRPT